MRNGHMTHATKMIKQWCDVSFLLINSPVYEFMLTTFAISCESFHWYSTSASFLWYRLPWMQF